MQRPLFLLLAVIGLWMASAEALPAATYYVATTGSDSNPGTQSQPFQTIRKGIETAANGDTVLVADGRYTGQGNQEVDFQGKSLTLKSLGGAANCQIQSDFRRILLFHSGETAQAVVDGFTLESGGGSGFGGGILISGCSPTIRNSIFSFLTSRYNNAGYGGGGIAILNGNPRIANCLFDHCDPEGGSGGAIYVSGGVPQIQFCTFRGNSGEGGGLYLQSSNASVENCIFDSNTSQKRGGGICVLGGNPAIRRCTFLANGCNTVTYGGGGFYASNAPLTLYACVFSGNTAPTGGAVSTEACTLTLRDCIFTGNQATYIGINKYGGGAVLASASSTITATNSLFQNNTGQHGGAIQVDGASTMAIKHSAFTGNAASGAGGAVYVGTNLSDGTVTAVNSIFWGDIGGELVRTDGSSLTVTYSDVQGGFAGIGNINADPRFVNPAQGDLHLQSGSPCIQAGTASAPDLPLFDRDGNARIAGGTPDMGAYEFSSGPLSFYVDKATGSDANPGTSAAPFQTVSRALNGLTDPLGTPRIYVREGSYGSDRPRITRKLQLLNWGNTGQARIGQP
jgi:predicted outer membrane repeat protein